MQMYARILDYIFNKNTLFICLCFRCTIKARGVGGGGKHVFFSFHICDTAPEDKQVEKRIKI